MNERVTAIHDPIGIDKNLGSLREETRYERHIEQLMRGVLYTGMGERINRSNFGCGIRRMLFAPNNEVSASLAKITILEALERWLGDLIAVDEVSVTADDAVARIEIEYTIRNRAGRRILNLEFDLG